MQKLLVSGVMIHGNNGNTLQIVIKWEKNVLLLLLTYYECWSQAAVWSGGKPGFVLLGYDPPCHTLDWVCPFQFLDNRWFLSVVLPGPLLLLLLLRQLFLLVLAGREGLILGWCLFAYSLLLPQQWGSCRLVSSLMYWASPEVWLVWAETGAHDDTGLWFDIYMTCDECVRIPLPTSSSCVESPLFRGNINLIVLISLW